MDISIQDSNEKLLELWIKYSTLFKNENESKEEVRRNRLEIIKILDAKGINNIEIFGLDKDHYTLRYSRGGSKIFTKLHVPQQ